MSPPTVEALRAELSNHTLREYQALPGRTNHLKAGVLCPVQWSDDGLHVILTARAEHLRHHPGEISFPGGRPEPEDAGSLETTALREAREEIALEEAEILGRLSSIPIFTSDFRLEPFVAVAPKDAELRGDPSEVAEILRLSVSEWLERGEVSGLEWRADGDRELAPVFETQVAGKDRLIFGGTAYALYELLQVLARVYGAPPLRTVASEYTWADVLGPKVPTAGR